MQNGESPQPGVIVPQATTQPAVDASAPANSPQPTVSEDDTGISWTASEFIAHTKSFGWYALLACGALLLAGIMYVLGRDLATPIAVLVFALLFGVMASRKPRELTYIIDDNGVRVGEKFYTYASFKSFSVIQEEGVESIWFMPLQRFTPGLSIYFAPDDGDYIVNTLALFLPFEPRKMDPLDRLMHKIRF